MTKDDKSDILIDSKRHPKNDIFKINRFFPLKEMRT